MGALFSFLLLTSDDGFRCPDTRKLIHVGDSSLLVVQRCREPNSRNVRTEQRTRRQYVNGVWLDTSVNVEVEDWLYDFGRNEFVRELRFENGSLLRVRTAGYGGR